MIPYYSSYLIETTLLNLCDGSTDTEAAEICGVIAPAIVKAVGGVVGGRAGRVVGYGGVVGGSGCGCISGEP